MTMTLQKDFFICFASSRWLGILLFMESKKFMRFSARFVMIAKFRKFHFLQPTQFFSPPKTHVL